MQVYDFYEEGVVFLHNFSNFHSDFETLPGKMGGGIGASPGPQLTWMG